MFDTNDLADFTAPAEKPQPSRYDLALINVLRSPDGAIVIRKLLADAGIARSSFDTNPQVAAFREGERNVGLRLFADIARVDATALPALLLPETKQ